MLKEGLMTKAREILPGKATDRSDAAGGCLADARSALAGPAAAAIVEGADIAASDAVIDQIAELPLMPDELARRRVRQ